MSFEPQNVKIGPTVRPGCVPENNKGQHRTFKKVTKALYFTYLRRSPTERIFSGFSVAIPDIITCAKVLTEIFIGYDFTGGRVSHFPIDSCLGLTAVKRYCAACDLTT